MVSQSIFTRVNSILTTNNTDIKNRDFKLKDNAPPSVKGLVRVVQFVIVSKLGFEVTFDGQAIDEFDKKVNDTSSGGGSFAFSASRSASTPRRRNRLAARHTVLLGTSSLAN
jgi:hypothetical protein